MKKIILTLIMFISLYTFSQNYNYSFKVNEIIDSEISKIYFDDFRKSFNSISDPFKYELVFDEKYSIFYIKSDLNVNEIEIQKICNKNNLTLNNFNKK